MNKLAVHIRIAKPDPTDSDVTSRQLAINSLVKTWEGITDLKTFIAKASDIATAVHDEAVPAAALGQEVEVAIQQHSAAYVYTEYPREVGVCAALAVGGLFQAKDDSTETTARDVFAAALWCALAYQAPIQDARREALRVELLEACRHRADRAATVARERAEVPDVEDDGDEITEEFRASAIDAIACLRQNAVLDREELNFLWWVQLQRSRLLKKLLSKIDEPVRLVACAIEAAQFLKALPAEVHRDLVLRTVDEDPSLDHSTLLGKLGADRPVLAAAYATVDVVQTYPSVFPLLSSLDAARQVNGPASKVFRASSEWAQRALLESTIAELYRGKTVVP